jgi:hypothetical protein
MVAPLSDLLSLFISLIVFGPIALVAIRKAKDTNKTPTKTEPLNKSTPKEKRLWTPIRRAAAAILAVATLIGGIVAALFFWPRMTMTTTGLFDESNAYSEQFTILNTGFLAFEDMHIGIGICSMETTDGPGIVVTPSGCPHDEPPRVLLSAASWQTPELRRDEPFSIVLTDALTIATDQWRKTHPNIIWSTQMMPPLKAANFIFRVSFRPWPSPKYIAFLFRFVAEQQPNGKILWRAVPLSWRAINLPE